MLFANDIVALRCQGHLEGNRFLDGRTVDGSAGLAPNIDVPPFTGTWWRTHDAGGGELFIECLGHLPGNRFLDGRTLDGTVGLAPNTDAPFTGTLWQVIGALSNFTFAADISAENRNRLIDRHRFAVASIVACNSLSEQEKLQLYQAYRRAINHTTLNQAGVNASATVGGSVINVNFGVLFPQGDEEISQTLIHEMVHCAGSRHPTRRNPPAGMSCAAPNPSVFDCPNDNGQYYGTPPLRAEFCIAGDQSDVLRRLERKADNESCIIDEQGVATLHTQ